MSLMMYGNDLKYLANGNLITDADRGISVIKYNILNLPDTIQFVNGGKIVNFYDAAGRKYKSITYTNTASVIPQQYDFTHYSFETDSLNYHVTEYAGNIELHKIKKDTALTTFRRIHNTIGYYDTSDSTYFHYIKDHLGNICAVVNSTADTVVQRTMYYASGVPMAQSWGRDTQPYLYNGKEFVEAHGWNTYDYGFRGYYATIGRFTSIDPLAEQTPWQSPYVYANNNPINKIDYMGLSGNDSFAHDNSDIYWNGDLFGIGGCSSEWNPWSWSIYGELVDVCNWAAIDGFGNIVGWGNDNDDWHVYRVDGKWDGTYAGLEGHSTIVGWEILDDYGNQPRYEKGQPAYWLGAVQTSAYMNGETYIIGSKTLMYGNQIVDNSNIIDSNVDAVLHYYFGGGRSIQNGPTALAGFFSTPEYHLIIHNIAQGITHGIMPVAMKPYMFHIGTTSCSYHVNGEMVVIAFALYDSFSDPNYWKENNYKAKGIDLTDGLGPNLELGGTPYNYIPTVFVIR